jgi:hypothetical protein
LVAWLLDDKKGKEGGRPKLPAKFKKLMHFYNPLHEAVIHFDLERCCWRNSRRRFPYEEKLENIAAQHGVDKDTLHNKLKRGPKSGRKVGG